MRQSPQISKSIGKVPLYSTIILATVFAFGLFLIGYDQGHVFSIIQGEHAFVEQFLHELTHDIRHAAGFPCH